MRSFPFMIALLCCASLCNAEINFKPFGARQSAALLRLRAVVAQALQVEATLSNEQTRLGRTINIRDLQAWAGDTTAAERLRQVPILGEQYAIRAYAVAAETTIREGKLQEGQQLFAKAMEAADHSLANDAIQRTCDANSYGQIACVMVRAGQTAEVQKLIGATSQELSWIEKLPAEDKFVALCGAAEGYLEVMTGRPTEKRFE